MTATSSCLAQLSRLCISSMRPTFNYAPARFLSVSAPYAKSHAVKSKLRAEKKAASLRKMQSRKGSGPEKKKKKPRTTFIQYDQKDLMQFSLCDAMRYIRAHEVGRTPTSVKYEMAIKLKTLKNGATIKNRLRLPHPVKTNLRICVICPPDSKYAESALAAGATLVGEEEIFEAVKDGRIEFDRCICQTSSLEKMNKAGLGRYLGPKGLMPSAKLGTVVKDPGALLKGLIGGAEYRERAGVIRMAIGQLGFSADEMHRNIKVFVEAVKKDIAQISERTPKEIAEIVLSSTNGPGLSLNGKFHDPESPIIPQMLAAGS